jgi:hypothetical protein
MRISDSVKFVLGKLLYFSRGHDSGLFIHGPALKGLPESSLSVTSPSCGPSGSTLSLEYLAPAAAGLARRPGSDTLFPDLLWTAINDTSSSVPEVLSYLLIVEDPDAPLPTPIVIHRAGEVPWREDVHTLYLLRSL